MYKNILVTLDHSPADETILQHIEELHKFIPSDIILLHVADGWAARHFNELKLKESEEIKKDRAYLASVEKRLQDKGITATTHLAMGEPADQIIKLAQQHHCD
jgi:nucleotide-binding universal stress UspA family protein